MFPNPILYCLGKYKSPPWQIPIWFFIALGLNKQLCAQVQSGQFYLGGQFSAEANTSQNQNSFSAQVQPELGIMLSSKWSVGLSAPFRYETYSPNRHFYRLGVRPFVRRYFDLKSGFYAIVQLQGETQFKLDRNINQETPLVFRLVPALSYFFSPRFAFEAGFGEFSYNSTRFNDGMQDNEYHSSKLELRFVPVFSLRYYFPHPSKSPKA